MFYKTISSLFFICFGISFAAAAAVTKKCSPLTLTPGTLTPKLGIESKTADKIELPVSCTGENNKEIYMFFNGNIGGPSHPKNEPITAHLHCIDGNWKYTESGVSIVITEVSCISV